MILIPSMSVNGVQRAAGGLSPAGALWENTRLQRTEDV